MSLPKREYPLVKVIWDDAASSGGWDKVAIYRERYNLVPIRSAGYMISKSSNHVKLVISMDNIGKVCDGLAIPKSCIRSLRVIRKADKRLDKS